MTNSRFIDESFDTNNSQNYKISIQCSLNGFSFLIEDSVSGKLIAFFEREMVLATPYELKNELALFIKSETIFNYIYKKVNISFLNQQSILIPKTLANENEKESLFKISFDKHPDDLILHNNIDNTLMLLFSMPGVLYRFFTSQFSNPLFFSTLLPIINIGFNNNYKSPTLLVDKNADLLSLLFIHARKIHFVNQFYVKTDTDCLYYILNVAKQFQFTPKTAFRLIGKIDKESELTGQLLNYFQDVSFILPTDELTKKTKDGNNLDTNNLTIKILGTCE
jgi:hypothetical protein